MSRINGYNVVSSYSPYAYAACSSTVRSPIGTHGMSHPLWVQSYKDSKLTDAIHLDALSGMGCERGQNAPSRDEGYFQVVVEQRPVLQFPEEVTRESDLVPSIWNKQVDGSCGLDVGNDQLAAVDSVVNVTMKSIVHQMSNNSSMVVVDQSIMCRNCKKCTVSNVEQTSYSRVDFSLAASQLASGSMDADISKAVKAQADAISKTGFGLSIADTDTAIKSFTNVQELVKNTAITVFSQKLITNQEIDCENSEEASFTYIKQSMTVDMVTRAIVSQGSFNTQLTRIVEDLEAAAKSSATGYDPIGSVALIAIAVVVGLLLVFGGGSLVGFEMAKDVIMSPYTWMGVMGFLMAMCSLVLAGEMFEFWPHQKVDALDAGDEDVARKKKINTVVTVSSSVMLALSTLGLVGIIYFKFAH